MVDMCLQPYAEKDAEAAIAASKAEAEAAAQFKGTQKPVVRAAGFSNLAWKP